MVLVDTSIWIALYRREKSDLGQKIWALTASNEAALCGQIWVEFIGGFRKKDERKEYEGALQAFPFLETTRGAYSLAASLLANHPRLGAGDAIIAATAIDTKSPLWTLDKDFRALLFERLVLF